MTDLEARRTEPLVEARVDVERVGELWPEAIVQLIEAHEIKNLVFTTRKERHVLMERYRDRYFPGMIFSYAHRHRVIALMSRRGYDRFVRYFEAKTRRFGYPPT